MVNHKRSGLLRHMQKHAIKSKHLLASKIQRLYRRCNTRPSVKGQNFSRIVIFLIFLKFLETSSTKKKLSPDIFVSAKSSPHLSLSPIHVIAPHYFVPVKGSRCGDFLGSLTRLFLNISYTRPFLLMFGSFQFELAATPYFFSFFC